MTLKKLVPVPLYHGTSKIFLSSIHSFGLGAKDPNVMFRTREMLDELVSAREWNWYEEPFMLEVRKIVQQRVTDGGFNFRHGSTYLSPSRTTAVRYALNNRYGSELLETTFNLLEKLKAYDLRRASEIVEEYPDLLKLQEMPHQPLLVEAFDVPTRHLRSEQGEDPSPNISMLRENADDMNEPVWQQLNFELTDPLSAAYLNYYCIEPKNADPIFPEYSLKIVQPPAPTMDLQP